MPVKACPTFQQHTNIPHQMTKIIHSILITGVAVFVLSCAVMISIEAAHAIGYQTTEQIDSIYSIANKCSVLSFFMTGFFGILFGGAGGSGEAGAGGWE